ncbi:SOS response-associated peptidase [Corynebacterium pacaense]|uniref:SOS response-associated peptidase n=1 Tax=Corynebacterium pacaense TaxID=1816684 RepID=UPI0009BA1E07|nr:SOS response-associated peptidase [Corynebacterium pacaense]
MCGRFVLFTTGEMLIDAAESFTRRPVGAPEGTPGPRYNLAPTQTVPMVHVAGEKGEKGEALLEPARWGLLPNWKKDDSGPPLFNARSETVAAKPSFRDAFKRQRCIIPMDGYYEWHEKKPYFVSLGGELMWAAGLWATGAQRISATILTTAAAEPIEWLHDRMPRFLERGEAAAWLGGSVEEATALLHPVGPQWRAGLVTRPVGAAVGNVRNDYAELLD